MERALDTILDEIAETLGFRLIDSYNQNRTVAAKAIAERYVSGHLS